MTRNGKMQKKVYPKKRTKEEVRKRSEIEHENSLHCLNWLAGFSLGIVFRSLNDFMLLCWVYAVNWAPSGCRWCCCCCCLQILLLDQLNLKLESFETLEDLKNVGKYEHIRSIYMQVVAGGQGGGTQNHYFQFGEMDWVFRIFIVTVCLQKFHCKHSSLPRRGNVRMKRVWKTHRILVCCQGSLMMLCYLEGSPHPNNLDSQFSLFFLWTIFAICYQVSILTTTKLESLVSFWREKLNFVNFPQ